MSEWCFTTLGENILEIVDRRGVTPLKLGSDFTNSGYQVISAKLVKGSRIDLNADVPRFVDSITYKKWMSGPLQSDDVILTSEAPLGEVAYVKDTSHWCLGQRLFAIRTNKSTLHGRYLFYALTSQSVKNALQARATGTTVVGIRQSELRKLPILLPPIHEQKAIAHILGTLDDKIDQLRKTNTVLEDMASALFKSWFVDFDPVKAKQENRPTGLPKDLDDLFPDSFEDSTLGPIPTGWRVGCVGDVASITKGTTPTQQDLSEAITDSSDVNFLRVNAISNEGVALLEKLTRIPTSVHVGVLKRSVLQSYDILYSIAGTIGRTCIVEPWILPANTNQALAIIRCISGVPVGWLHRHLTSSTVSDGINSSVVQAVQANVSLTTLAKVRLAIPPASTFVIYEQIASMDQRVYSNRSQIRILTNLRDTLLPKLISGDLRVPEAEQMVAELGL